MLLKLQALLTLHHTRKPFHEIQRTRRSHMRVEYDWPSSEASQSDWPTSLEMTCFHELPSSGYRRSRRCGQHTFISLYKSSSPTGCTQKHRGLLQNRLRGHQKPSLFALRSPTQRENAQSFRSCADAMAGSWRARGSLIVLAIVTFGECFGF